jgi:hypothetical protein
MASFEVSDEEIAALTSVEYKRSGGTAANTAENILAQAAPGAAQSIVNLSLNGNNERVRLSASQYIIDRACGRVGDPREDGKGSPVENLLGAVMREPSGAELEDFKRLAR